MWGRRGVSKREILVGLIGNPNVGKSSVFNRLTGAKQRIGNWPGKTVEKKEGWFRHRGFSVHVVDLPGVYSLSAISIDEAIARDFIVEEKPDVVVDIVDASNLERNLYLVLQLIELEANLVIALNKIDLAQSMGFEVDHEALSRELSIPVVPTIATKGYGIDELKDAIISSFENPQPPKPISYGEDVEQAISELVEAFRSDAELSKYPLRWLAIMCLERDQTVASLIKKSSIYDKVKEVLDFER